MLEFLTFLAVWCGQPYGANVLGGTARTGADVQACRDRMLTCYVGTEKPTPQPIPQVKWMKAVECAQKEKLK